MKKRQSSDLKLWSYCSCWLKVDTLWPQVLLLLLWFSVTDVVRLHSQLK